MSTETRSVEEVIFEVRMLGEMMGLAAEEIVARESSLGNTLATLASRIRVCAAELQWYVEMVPDGSNRLARATRDGPG